MYQVTASAKDRETLEALNMGEVRVSVSGGYYCRTWHEGRPTVQPVDGVAFEGWYSNGIDGSGRVFNPIKN